jgi:uncharacterized protein YjbI with pentapeptide repeats
MVDEMNDLIFDHNLRDSPPGADVRQIARTRTLTVLLNMDSERKRRPLKAVYELDLVSRANPILSLDQADLDRAVLSEADLSRANLSGAVVAQEQLDRTKFLEGTLMPGGSTHP